MAPEAESCATPCPDPRHEVREALAAALIGVGVFFLMFLARPEPFGWRLASYGALTGLLIYVSCRLLNLLIGEPLKRRKAVPQTLVTGVLFLAGGILGWSIATLISGAIGLTQFQFSARDIGIAFAVAGGLGAVFGFAFYSYGLLRERLRASVERLKEAEFAEKELELARSIQARLLPPTEVAGDGYRVFARNLPARFVAGDFYDVFHLADGSLGLVIADVAGKGMGAALIMASVKAVVPLVAAECSAGETLTRLNRKLCAELSAREFVALCFARYDTANATLEIANAGLPDPYLLSDGRVRTLSVPGPRLPLGVRKDVRYEVARVEIGSGGRVLFVTDGLPEAPTPAGEPLGYEAMAGLLASAAVAPEHLLERLFDSVRAAARPGLEDDWTALLFERRRAISNPV